MKFLVILTAVPSFTAAVCHHGTSLWAREVDIATFDYEGETGPIGWAALDEANEQCARGIRQSPVNLVETPEINIVQGVEVKLSLPSVYGGAELENLGSTLEVMMEGKNASVAYNGMHGELKQFHFHTPSEHHIRGEHYPMETHFVFDTGENGLIVLGVPIEVSYHDDLLISSTFKFAHDVEEPGAKGETGDLFFGALTTHVRQSPIWTYGGSLTTPPCSEVVTWLVVESPIYISPITYKSVKGIMGFNARYTQNTPGAENLLVFAKEQIFG